jgi:putative lipase involved disintegration of autophagic bodies
MARADLLLYAYMAKASYQDSVEGVQDAFTEADGSDGHGYRVVWYQVGNPANGFQGAIFENDDEVICAYKGSKGGIRDRTTTGYDDWSVNDVQIAMNRFPSQTPAALDFADVAKAIAESKPISIVGHSLGGALAQLVGYALSLPFVTFNAPGVRNNLQGVSWGVRKVGQVQGFNMILASDPVGNFGVHLGKTERFLTKDMFNPFKGDIAHKMGQVIATLKMSRNRDWAQRTLGELL